jgi:hypothetical protein
MNRVEDLLSTLQKKENEKNKNTVLWVFAIIGTVTAIAAIAYGVYRFFTPTYIEDFEDDFEDDFDDYFDEEEEEVVESVKEEVAQAAETIMQ